jgi:rubrerythrin
MRDRDYDPDAVREYECFDCGKIVESSDDPGLCPVCNTEMRDRHFGME